MEPSEMTKQQPDKKVLVFMRTDGSGFYVDPDDKTELAKHWPSLDEATRQELIAKGRGL